MKEELIDYIEGIPGYVEVEENYYTIPNRSKYRRVLEFRFGLEVTLEYNKLTALYQMLEDGTPLNMYESVFIRLK